MSSWEKVEQNNSILQTILNTENQILAAVNKISLAPIQKEVMDLGVQIANLRRGQAALADALSSLTAAAQSCCNEQNVALQVILANTQQILNDLVPPPAVAFTATVTLNNQTETQGENNMAKPSRKVAGDLQVADDGTFSITLSFTDSDGVATAVPAGLTATYTASDATPGPSSLTLVSPGSSGDASTCAGSINQSTIQALVAAGTALPTGLTVSITASWTGLASPLTVTATPPIDVVAGPASTFVAAETTP